MEKDQRIKGKFTIIIPAYNEARTVRKVVQTALKVQSEFDDILEIILVDDGCTDKTIRAVADLPIKIISHRKNKGYTAALSAGISATKTEFVAIIDADWQNITSLAIAKILAPIRAGKADLVKASFSRARGRVTNFAVKPMMSILYPEYDFEQPISGQFAGPTAFFESVEIGNSWGIAIGILLEALKSGLRVIEVDVGKLVHKSSSDDNIAEMSRQVLETMIKKAGLIQHKYKIVIFTLDETLIRGADLKIIYEKLGVSQEVLKLQDQLKKKEITFGQMASRIALILKEIKPKTIEEIIDKLPLTKYSVEVVKALQTRKYKVAIISSNFSPIVLPIARRLGIPEKAVDCIFLESKRGILTGKITRPSKERWFSDAGELKFDKAFQRILRLNKTKEYQSIMVANSKKSAPLHKSVGLSIAYRPKDRELKKLVDKTITVLAEILALVE